MKIKHVILQLTRNRGNHEELYQVVQLVNCIEPTVGSVLTKHDASELIARHNTKVTIRRAKS